MKNLIYFLNIIFTISTSQVVFSQVEKHAEHMSDLEASFDSFETNVNTIIKGLNFNEATFFEIVYPASIKLPKNGDIAFEKKHGEKVIILGETPKWYLAQDPQTKKKAWVRKEMTDAGKGDL